MRRVEIGVFLLFIAVGAGAVDGRFCVDATSRCFATDAKTVSITAPDHEALFTWTSGDGAQTSFGVVAPGETKVSVDPATNGGVKLAIEQNGNERWPETTTIAFEQGRRRWMAQLDGRAATTARLYRLQPGEYTLTITAPHYRGISESITVPRGERDLKTRTLLPNPILRGVVRTKSGDPIAAALVVPQPGKQSAATDALGTFAIEIDGEWPSALQVSFPEMATRLVDVPAAQRDTTLDPIMMSAGSRLVLRVTGADVKRARLFRVVDPITRKESAKRDVHGEEVVFDDVDAGEYAVVFEGDDPLQRAGMKVDVSDAATIERTIALKPIPLVLHIARGEKPLRASVELKSFENRWSTTLSTNDDGDAQAEAWERGPFLFFVHHAPQAPPFAAVEEIEGTDSAAITIRLPERTVIGQVVDAASGAPLPNATIHIDSENADGTGTSFPATTDADGRFEIPSLLPGAHTLTARAESHLESEPMLIRMTEEDRGREANFSLRRGRERRIEVVTRAGLPARAATVIHAIDGRFDRMYTTDDSGHAMVRTAENGSVIYILPREGSFAVLRFASGSPGSARVVIPDPNAALLLHAVDEIGKPIRDIRFLVRYDGELIPPDVLAYFDRIRGITFRTAADGTALLEHVPSGMFELWPMRTDSDERDLIAATSSTPVQISAKPGFNEATLAFRRR